MQTSTVPSLVRADQRFTCSLGAVMRVAPDMAENVVLARAAGEGDGTVKVVVVDVSRGGIGVTTPVFLPRGMQVVISIAGDSSGPLGTLLGRVQRVEMRDRTPLFYLGIAMVTPAEAAPVLQDILAQVRTATPTLEGRR